MVELPWPIQFHTEFGISSIHGGQMDLLRVTAVSAHTLAAGHLNHSCWQILSTLRAPPSEENIEN